MARIRLYRDYRGWKTGERIIKAGDYDLKDPALFGAGLYLVETGHADGLGEPDVTVTPTEEERPDDAVPGEFAGGFVAEGEELEVTYADVADESPEPEPERESTSGLDALNRSELEDMLAGYGIDLDSIPGNGAGGNLLKADLIAAILDYEAGQ